MSHRARHGNAVHLPGQDIRCGIHPTDVKTPRLLEPGVGALHPPQAKIHNRPAPRCPHDASRFRRRECSKLNLIHQKSLDDLSLRQRRNDLDQRLVGKNDGSFGNGVDVAHKTEAAQTFEKWLRKTIERTEVVDRVRSK